MTSAVKTALRDMVFTFLWVNLSATFGIQTAAIVSATGFHGIPWAPPVITILIVFVSISIFSVIGDFLGGASFNPCGNAAFYTAGVSRDSLFSLAIRSPAQVLKPNQDFLIDNCDLFSYEYSLLCLVFSD